MRLNSTETAASFWSCINIKRTH